MDNIYNAATQRTFLRNRCGFSAQKWDTFWKSVLDFLQKPENMILRDGPEKHGDQWDNAVEDFLADVAEVYWGRHTNELWNVGIDDEAPDRAMYTSH